MDIVLAGPDGPMLRWTRAVLETAMAMAHPALECAGVADPAGPEPAWRIVVAPYIGESHVADLETGGVRAILVLDDPAVCYRELRAAGHGPAATLRHLASGATPLGELAGAPGMLTLARGDGRTAAAVLGAIIDHLGLDLDRADLAARCWVGAPDLSLDKVLRCLEPSSEPAALSPEEDALVQAVLAPAFHYGATGERTPVFWPRSCLFWGNQPDAPAPRILDITGPARILVYGPYFPLPAGRWRMSATLAFSPAARGTRLSLWLVGGSDIARCRFAVERAGVFAASIAVTVPRCREALEIRLMVEHGAIEGELGIDGIRFEPEAAA